MSTLAFDNWRPSAGGTAVGMAGGLAKAWGMIATNGVSAASFNFSSITDVGTGVTQPAFVNNFAAATYAVNGSIHVNPTGSQASTFVFQVNQTNFTAGYTMVHCLIVSNGAGTDAGYYHASWHGDLA